MDQEAMDQARAALLAHEQRQREEREEDAFERERWAIWRAAYLEAMRGRSGADSLGRRPLATDLDDLAADAARRALESFDAAFGEDGPEEEG